MLLIGCCRLDIVDWMLLIGDEAASFVMASVVTEAH